MARRNNQKRPKGRLGWGLVLLLAAFLAGRSGLNAPASEESAPSPAENRKNIAGRVVTVPDGDTLTLRTDGGREVKVRLFGIDAPEMDQDWGRPARRLLSGLTDRRTVRVEQYGRDQYGRVVGRVFVEDRPVDREMVAAGRAWVYERYCSAPHCDQLRAEQQEARQKKLGLWEDKNPEPPWIWRRQHRR